MTDLDRYTWAPGDVEFDDDAVVASATQFANPWHDAAGRFAPKGTGSMGAGPKALAGGRPGMGDIPLPPFIEHDSAFAHLDPTTGGFTPERQALHDEIVNSVLDGVPSQENPELLFMGGGGGAGKSTVLRSGLVPTPKDGAHVDPDEIKQKLPEVVSMQASGDTTWASFSHEESSYLGKRVQAAAIERSVSMTVDGVGGNPGKVGAQAELARANGYTVRAAYVTIPPGEALRRAHIRGEETGRFVPERTLLSAHASANAAFPQVAALVDSAMLVDNTAGPSLIATFTRGARTIVDPAGWEAFIPRAGI